MKIVFKKNNQKKEAIVSTKELEKIKSSAFYSMVDSLIKIDKEIHNHLKSKNQNNENKQ